MAGEMVNATVGEINQPGVNLSNLKASRNGVKSVIGGAKNQVLTIGPEQIKLQQKTTDGGRESREKTVERTVTKVPLGKYL